MTRRSFPPGFTWGAATSSYQIEGAVDADGRGPSIWDTFCATPGKVAGGDTGAVACDHYHRWPEDLAILSDLGVGAYRFSLAWPRLLPEGRGRVEERGLAFYDRLVDGLLARGIEPWVTLYHWDLPQPLEDRGGWPSRDTVGAFEEFADLASRRYGDRVKRWITINEPWVAAVLGYRLGIHAPGRVDPAAALAASHHLLLAHGRAVPILRANSPGAHVGIALNLTDVVPASSSAADADQARRDDGDLVRWYLDPLHGRGYPADLLADHAADGLIATPWDAVRPGDLDAIAAPTDFLGINYYTRGVAHSRRVPEDQNLPREVPPAAEVTDFGWEVTPDSLTALLGRLSRDWPARRIVITENGASYGTPPGPDGRVRDEARVRYLRDHLVAAHRAIEQGAPLTGYFAWSLLDNFEWAEGYRQRFGLVWVDFATQARLPKDSARFYRDAIRAGGVD